jgi:hypothetical protein
MTSKELGQPFVLSQLFSRVFMGGPPAAAPAAADTSLSAASASSASSASTASNSNTPVPLPDLADVWVGDTEVLKEAKSIDPPRGKGGDVKVAFRNLGDDPLVLCWVDHDGKPHHFYRLDPSLVPEGSDMCVDDRIEYSHVGHAFVVAAPASNSVTIKALKKQKHLNKNAIVIGGVRGKKKGHLLVEIRPRSKPKEAVGCCRGFFRGGRRAAKKVKVDDAAAEDEDDDDDDEASAPRQYDLIVQRGRIDPTPLDSTGKKYVSTTLGGWPVRLDARLKKTDPRLKPIAEDLDVLCRRLPPHAKAMLEKSTPLWINDTFRYGPRACPVEAKACCFHPDVEWLKENGCLPAKAECVELYDLDDYNATRDRWLPGGVMLHEYSHAYHWKCLPRKYDNPDILKCYEAAMQDKLYDRVQVHGTQGPYARAYACENQMEYYAELSTAFLGGLDFTKEYNKWFPFNRSHIKSHDPRAYSMLQQMWQVQASDSHRAPN